MSENYVQAEGIFSKGFGMIGKVVMTDKRITVHAKAIYAYICSFAGNGFSAFPSVPKICNDLNIGSKNTFFKHLKLLKECDYIRVSQQKVNGKFKSNVYTVVLQPNPTEYHLMGYGNLPHGKKWDTVKCDTNSNSINKNKSTYNKNKCFSQNKELKEHEKFNRREYGKDELEQYYQDVTK